VITWFTSDQHFDHANAIKLCKRPFVDAEEMNDVMVIRWNELVGANDIVYQLGDFTLGSPKIADMFFSRLSGQIKVLGNPWHHDQRWLNKGRMMYVSASKHVVEILPPMVVLEDVSVNNDGRGIPLVLCHYPLAEWDRKHYGAWHLHGHCHGNFVYPPGTLALDAGMDVHNFYPISLARVARIMESKADDNH
jgi:calcineurin-like phosphoesterase family protein